MGGELLTLDDCIAFGELSRDVVLAIAEHERVPELSAVAIGSELVQCIDGIQRIQSILETVIASALARGDTGYARTLETTLANFMGEHPGVFG